MKRGIISSLLLAAGAIVVLERGYEGQQPLQIQKVKENLYMIAGNGGNTAAFVTDGGVTTLFSFRFDNDGRLIEAA